MVIRGNSENFFAITQYFHFMFFLMTNLNAITEIYNNSPLGKCSGLILKLIELLIKLMGMNTDHCAKEKKDA